jgi:hypothetical protein
VFASAALTQKSLEQLPAFRTHALLQLVKPACAQAPLCGAAVIGGCRAELARRLEEVIHAHDDHVLIFDLGPADKVDPRVESLGKTFESVKRTAVGYEVISRCAIAAAARALKSCMAQRERWQGGKSLGIQCAV